MVIRVDVAAQAIEEIKGKSALRQSSGQASKKSKVILLTPQGKVFTQEKARELAKLNRIILVCGHYEGFDERIRENLIDEEISIGDYVLTGGEIPAMVVCDSVVRLLPGVLEKKEATEFESFGEFNLFGIKEPKLLKELKKIDNKIIEYPQYTRPLEFRKWGVPDVLISGNHEKIKEWRIKKAIEKTRERRFKEA